MRVKLGAVKQAIAACIEMIQAEGGPVGTHAIYEKMREEYPDLMGEYAEMVNRVGWNVVIRSSTKKREPKGVLSVSDIQARLGFGENLHPYTPIPPSEEHLIGVRMEWKHISSCTCIDLSLSAAHLDIQEQNDRKRNAEIRRLRDWLTDIALRTGKPDLTVASAVRLVSGGAA